MLRTAAVTMLAALALAPAALAQDDGVTYDDDSPAGQEYALPLPETRGIGEDDGGETGSSGAVPPATSGGGEPPADEGLFGAGVGTAAKVKGNGGSSRDGGASPSRGESGGTASAASETVPRLETIASTDGGPSAVSVSVLSALIAGVLVLMIAVVYHRRPTPPPSGQPSR